MVGAVARGGTVYGLDIETDTAAGGLDPTRAAVVAVAVATADGTVVLDGPELRVLTRLEALLSSLEPGYLATWNGAAFDLPFLASRAALAGCVLGLQLEPDHTLLAADHVPLPGHPCAYRARWHGHDHIDAYRLYRADVGRVLPVSCSLKSIARLVGIPAVQVDASALHELTADEVRRYVASDAEATRELALRRWATAVRYADHALAVR
jgi:uncharacterized protein YprB with RNaseH-like and TPR domain